MVGIPLAGLRARATRFMVDRALIARYTETSTSDGIEMTWATIAADVPCEVWPSGAAAAEGLGAGAGLRALSTWTVRVPALQDVTVRDRITISDGRTFEIQRADVRTWEVARDCICELVT